MKKEIVLSIIVPVYNVESYLINCLDSIINQTFEEFELILIDDGSTDNSGAICDEYAQKDKRIIVIHKKNGGLSSARNKGLDIAVGKYITFVDSDDEIEQNTYSSNINLLDNNSDIDILQYPTYWYYQSSNEYKDNLDEQSFCGEEDIISSWWEGNVLNPSAWNKIYRKEMFSNIRYPEGHINEDIYLIVDFARLAKKVYISKYGCYYYYLRDNSISNSQYTLSKNIDLFVGQLKVYKELCSFKSLQSCKLRSFYRVFRRLITTQISYPNADLSTYTNELKNFVPNWIDIVLSKDKKYYIWIFCVKLLGLSIFMNLFCRYIRAR